MIGKFRKIASKVYKGGMNSQQVLESAQRGEYSDETAADWMAEAATQQYLEGNISDNEMIEYLEAASNTATQETTIQETFQGLQLEPLGPMDEIIPNSPGRDRSREGMRTDLPETDLSDYDLVVAAGGSSYSFADELAEQTETGEVTVALNRGLLEEQETELEDNHHTISYKFAPDSVVETVGSQVEDKDILFVTDQGKPGSERGKLSQAMIQATESYEHLDIKDLENGINL